MEQSKIDLLITEIRSLNENEFTEPITSENNWENLCLELQYLKDTITEQKARTKMISSALLECSAGEFTKKLPISEKEDAIDSICMAFNLYTEEIENLIGNQVNNSQTEQISPKQQPEMKKTSETSILIAEDNVINQMLISTILAQEGYKTFIADNGAIAVEELAKNEYDMILMDLMMPVMNGYEATEFVRENMQEPKKSIPIIAVSADVTKDIKEKCLKVGMNDYISKPYTQQELIQLIKKHIFSNI
jgi:CheY-like chemotaxis protein